MALRFSDIVFLAAVTSPMRGLEADTTPSYKCRLRRCLPRSIKSLMLSKSSPRSLRKFT
eukprot:CAMPEP_0169173518 /NCGR_PEP_ID=MMETSP1015-20121227/63965_1 /TAXON_ID=342587 /ORGANISM="Karlodinium micrum, Strain CCMP2283" /LENGTH=58 /DNA_ID=CAMNT_0009247135 /DNA_START=49 /DNA_END=221 /DNA_ORIENTATION=+